MAVDLHIHSTISDGTRTPEEIVATATQRGLYAISITDHDDVAGVARAQRAAADELLVLPGVEVSTDLHDAEVHILGYLIDCQNEPLLAKLAQVRARRVWRAREMVKRLNSLGVSLDYAQVAQIAGEGSVGRPHVARALFDQGVVGSQAEAFRRFLHKGGPAYAPRYKLSPAEAIALIRQASGVAVVAHPGLCRDDEAVEEVLQLGISGLEAYHTSHTDLQTEKYLRMADEYGLLVTGGSDSHGPGGPIPVGVGSVDVPDAAADALVIWAKNNGGHITAIG